MSETDNIQNKSNHNEWRSMYKVGFFSCAAFPLLIVLAIIAYFIWPYTPGLSSVADIFAKLNDNTFKGLISLDLAVPVLGPVLILHMLALYAALQDVNKSYALIALITGITGIVLWLCARPMAEMVYLAKQYAAVAEPLKGQYLAAGEALNSLFNGTAWMLSQIFIPLSFFISTLLMVRSKHFSKLAAYFGIVFKPFGMAILIPGIGAILGVIGTLGGVIWYGFLTKEFFRMGWPKEK